MPGVTAAIDHIYSEFGGDPDMADLVELYVDEMPARVRELKQCADAKDWHAMERLAHQIKGSAGGYGFAPITDGALRLEQVVRASSQEQEIFEALSELLTLCDKVRCGTAETNS